MASNITLSASVRQNLLSLQTTAELMSMTQNRLATGKKVNSALDNPGNFFTSQSLNNRASDLNALLDSIGQAQQTLKAADTGITSLTKLVESAKSIAKQAQQATAPTATFSQTITGSAIATDTAGTPAEATSSSTLATVLGTATASNVASLEIDATQLATDLTDGDTFTITYDGTSVTFEYDTNSTSGGGNVAFTDAATLTTALENAFGAGNVDNNANTITLSGTDYTNDFSTAFTGTGNAVLGTNTTSTDGDVLTINDGTNTATFRYVASGAVAADGTFSDLTSLIAAATASNLSGVTVADDGSGNVEISSNNAFTVGGDLGTDLGFNTTAYNPTAASNSTLSALAGQSLSITVGSGTANTLSITASTTRADVSTWLSGLNLGTGISAALTAGGEIEITSTSSETITVGGAAASALGFTAPGGTYEATASVTTPSSTRSNLQTQYNELLTQIDALARDASYNGINLLNGDDLKVVFNEDGSSFQTITGVTYTSAGLGLSNLSGDEFQTNAAIDAVIEDLDGALSTLRSQAAKFGSNLTTVQTRQDFTKNMINTLQTGADALVLADTNEEGANLLALQTRQQLSTTALSLSAQADQAVLRLF
jgi:flagellin